MLKDKKPEGENNIKQTGQAGRDLIQVGRDYLNYIKINVGAGNWSVIVINFVVITVMLYVIGGISGALFGVLKNIHQNIYISLSNLSNSNNTSSEIANSQSSSDVNSSRIKQSQQKIAPDFEKVSFDCHASPAGQYLDLEFGCSFPSFIASSQDDKFFKANAKNYSRNWYELKDYQKNTYLVPPLGRGYIRIIPPQNYNTFKDLQCVYQNKGCDNRPEFKSSLQARRYSGLPRTKINIACDDKPKEVWKLTFQPRCTTSGTYIEVQSKFSFPIEATLPNGNTYTFNKFSKNYFTSGNRATTFTLSVKN